MNYFSVFSKPFSTIVSLLLLFHTALCKLWQNKTGRRRHTHTPRPVGLCKLERALFILVGVYRKCNPGHAKEGCGWKYKTEVLFFYLLRPWPPAEKHYYFTLPPPTPTVQFASHLVLWQIVFHKVLGVAYRVVTRGIYHNRDGSIGSTFSLLLGNTAQVDGRCGTVHSFKTQMAQQL